MVLAFIPAIKLPPTEKRKTGVINYNTIGCLTVWFKQYQKLREIASPYHYESKQQLTVRCTSVQAEYQSEDDFMPKTDKMKLIVVATELVKDAQLKIRLVGEIRDAYSGYKPFDVGIILGNIREKYRRMLEIYREFRDKENGRSKFLPNSIWQLYPMHYLGAFEQVHTLEVDIDKLVHILESMEDAELNPDPRDQKPLRSGNVVDLIKEEEVKSKLREQGLMRRIGMQGHTPRQRFYKQWPVEESWTMGPYGDMGLYGQ
ncbi:hypothetical protein ACJJTC_001688 [Scirpophaga incertulas]